jgi:hypothetical protein
MLKRAANIQGFKLLCNNTLFFFLYAVLSLNSMKNPPQYSEKSGFPGWVFWLIALLPVSIFLFQRFIMKYAEPFDWVGLIIIAAVGWLLYVIKLSVNIHSEGIDYRFPPFHNKSKRLIWEDIESLELMRINPVREFGGWGLRYGKLGTAYTTRGRYILHIVQKTGKPINLTIAHPQNFIAANLQQQWPVELRTPAELKQ